MAEEQEGFSVVDKRRVAAEPVPEQTAPEGVDESALETPESDFSEAPEEEFQDMEGGGPRLTVRDRLLMCFDILHQGAWIALGKVADPSTGTLETNLDDARRAIDCVAYIAEKAEAYLDDATRREIRRIVGDLQINYVKSTS